MKKILTIVFAAIFGIMVISGVSMYFTYNNQEVSMRNQIEAQRGKIEASHDKMWKVISQKAEISQEYAASFDSIYTHIISGRYDKGDGSLMKWITEANPNFDSSLYKDIMQSVEILRTEFFKEQTMMLDLIRERKTLCETYPSKWFISNTADIEYEVISSTKTKTVMDTGLDDDVSLFKK